MKISEVKNNAFYQFPQWLLDEEYKNLSLRAKVMYMLIFDRRTLSIQNKWHDKNGDVFVYFTNQQFMGSLNCNEKTVIKAKKELQDFGLIKEERQGVNKPNRLYISGTVKNTGQELQKLQYGTVKNTGQELQKLQYGTVKNTGQELQKLQSIKTDNINTNLSRLSEPDGAGGNSLYSIEDASAENDLGIVYDWIYSEFGRQPTPFEIEDLKAFLEDHSKEVIKLAIKECVGNGKPYFKYLSSILRDWKQKGLVTAELVENRQKPKRSNSYQGNTLKLSDDGYNPRLGF
ncbi:phage protein [Streptococcus pneumoniae]|nr:phage protein [Streptococcus pneumoniae]VJG16130.1 phage protein [Streptococcus pneumoniae]VJZ02772.1 phage protein [Streptococcus pneumoniae]VKY59442.1 phage protein [Streptococcus pneumoniae]VLO13622.1 phage protein [Streptococcus pneumoniae]